MIKNEWKSLFHNKLLLVVLIAIVAIPVIYAGFFLNSMWDPYGNVDRLPVAVVNEDKPVEYKGKSLSIGQEMVDELKENDSLQFNFVDAQAASEGLKNGTYYMVVTIPENFSENASTLMDDEPKKMELKYETNPGTNYIASKMSETALTKIKDSVQEEVIRTYTETVFEEIGKAGDGMQEASDGAGQLKDGTQKAMEGNQEITDNLEKIADSSVTFTDGAKTLQSGLKKYTKGVAALNEKAPVLITGIGTLYQGTEDLAEGAKSLSEGTGQYVSGAETLADGTKAYIAGTGQLAEGAAQLAPLEKGLGAAYKGIAGLSAAASTDGYDGKGSPCLTTGTQSLEDGLKRIYENVSALEGTASAEGLTKLSSGLSDAKNGMSEAGKTTLQAAQGIETAQQILKEEISGENGLNAAVTAQNKAAADAVDKANEEILAANQTIATANDAVGAINQKIESTNDEIRQVQKEMDAAIKALDVAEAEAKDKGAQIDLTSQKKQLEEAKNNFTALESVPVLDKAGSIREIETFEEIKPDAQAEQKITEICSSLSKASKGLEQGASQMSTRASQLPSGLSDNPLTSLKEALKDACGGAVLVNSGTQQLAEGLGTLETQTADFPKAGEGITMLNEGFEQLGTYDQTLNDGADLLIKQGKNLTTGATQVSQGAVQLAKGVKALNDGAGQLAEGTGELAQNNQTLNDGAQQLAGGSKKIGSGASQLADGSRTLGEGVKQLADGSGELEKALTEGAQEVKDSEANDSNIAMFASPVRDEETKMTEVPNNGHAMAPYMMSVGLWVGALAFCLIYPLMQYKGKLKSGFVWWLSKASVLYPVAVLQGLLLILLLHFTIGFSPAELGKTMAFSCLTAVTFTSIMYFFNITLGKVGSFLMLVFMVIQLAGSAGTYPVEISPEFVAEIHWYLPFTYTVNSFRSTIAGGESIRTAVLLMTALFLIFTALTILAFHIKAKRRKEGKLILFDWLEERGMA